jgi:hypothetical protein
MSPFETYRTYLSIKSHFSNLKYDYFKYGGKSRASIESFNKRRDRYFFERTSRKLNDREVLNFFLANFIASDNPQSIWIGELINNGEENYKQWMKRQQSLSYIFKQESEELFSNYSLKEIFNCSKTHPILLKKYLANQVSLETVVIYEKIFKFVDNFDKKINDPIWNMVSLKIKKYSPFLNIDIFHFKKLLRVIVNE